MTDFSNFDPSQADPAAMYRMREASDLPDVVIVNNQHVIFDLLVLLNRKVSFIMADLTTITASVAQTTTVEQSALVLINGIAAQVAAAAAAAAAGDPAAVQALSDQLNASSTELAAAVAANTPAAPPAGP